MESIIEILIDSFLIAGEIKRDFRFDPLIVKSLSHETFLLG